MAVLWINASGRTLTVAPLGASFDLVVGEGIIAIGNPLGSLGGTVTEGIVSATARTITVDHVDMTLHNGVRAKHDLDLLYAQLVRCLSQICQTHDLTLLLRLEAAPGEVLSLLSRVDREVGLPRLVWSTPRIDTRNEMLNFSAESHKNPIFAAISSGDYPSPAAFQSALADWATVYPVGRLIEIEE